MWYHELKWRASLCEGRTLRGTIVRKAFIGHGSRVTAMCWRWCSVAARLGVTMFSNDCHSIVLDELFWDRMETGVGECDAFDVSLSHASLTLCWIDREVQFALERGRRSSLFAVEIIRLTSCVWYRKMVSVSAWL